MKSEKLLNLEQWGVFVWAKLVFRRQINYSCHMKRYTIIDHTADIGIVVTGRTKNAGGMVEAMFDLMVEQKTVP